MKPLTPMEVCILPKCFKLWRRERFAYYAWWWPYSGRSGGPWFEYKVGNLSPANIGLSKPDPIHCEPMPATSKNERQEMTKQKGDLVNVKSATNGRKLRGVIVKVGRIRKMFGFKCYKVEVPLGKGKSLIRYYRQSEFVTNPKQLKPEQL